MDVVGHENPGMNGHIVFARELMQPTCIGCEIFGGHKTGLPVIASLNDVLRETGRADPWKTWHRFILDSIYEVTLQPTAKRST
jgi:hypothetical protein